MPTSVLVTRPADQASDLIRALTLAGYRAIPCPMLAIESLPETAEMRQCIIDLDLYDLVIVTSVNAAKPALKLMDKYWPQWPAHLDWLAVGSATAKVLFEVGLNTILPKVGSSSEHLLELPNLTDVADQRILILKGVGGRTLLAETLVERGARVDVLELYQRRPLTYSSTELSALFAGGAPDVLLATSESVLAAIEQNLSLVLDDLWGLPLIVFSERIAGTARDHGFKQVIVVEDVSDRSILAALNVLS